MGWRLSKGLTARKSVEGTQVKCVVMESPDPGACMVTQGAEKKVLEMLVLYIF